MKRFVLALMLVAVSGTAVFAQQPLAVPELGVSVDIPSDWTVRQWELFDHLPATGLYHVQDSTSGQFVAVRRDECPMADQKELWLSGEVGRSREGKRVPLTDTAPIAFGEHRGFETIAPRGDIVYKTYSFFWTEESWCYSIELGAPEESIDGALEDFQGVVDSIVIAP